MKTLFTFFTYTVLLLPGKVCHAQTPEIIFNHVPPPEGSFYGLVGGITQDPKGYMWIASTGSGFFRYDGYQMTNYKNDPANPKSLANNWVECIYADSSGIIWLGTWGNGLDRFDPATGVFTHYRHDPKNPSSIAQDLVTAIYEDREGELWIGTHGGLDRLDRKTGKFAHYQYDENDPTSLSNDQVRVIYEDKKGGLWVGTGSAWVTGVSGRRPGEAGVPLEGGLNHMDRETRKFTRYMHDPEDPHSLAENKVRAIFEDSRGTFWVGTTGTDGLQIMDRAKGTFQRYPYDPLHTEKLSRPPVNKEIGYDQISFITEDAAGAIWIGTAGAGINRYDPVTQKIKHYSYADSAAGYADNSAWAHYTSRDGVLWISSFESNLYHIDLFHKNIPHINLGTGVNSIIEDGKGILWIGTNSGLIQKNKNTGKSREFVNDKLNPGSLSSDFVTSVAKDSLNNVWIGTYGGGLNRFNNETQAFIHYRHDLKNNNSLICDTIYHLYADNEQNLWIATFGGLDLMNFKTGNFTHFKNDPNDSNSISYDLIYSAYEDRDGEVWAGTPNGIDKLDSKTGKFKRYLGGNSILFIYQDSDGIIWAGGDGLFKLDAASDKFLRVMNPSNGRDLFQVASIIEDDQKNLWVASQSGIIKLNRERNNAITYGKDAGVDGNQLNGFATYKDREGQIFFGDTYGYYAFFPGKITSSAKAPEILLTDLKISNQSVQTGNNSEIDKPLWKSNELNLSYNENTFSFDFIIIDYTNPELNQSMYMLENYDDEWRIGGVDKRAYYFNVPPGEYILKIKAGNSNGIWAEKDIAVIITPPWWETWWFRVLSVLTLVAVIYAIIKERSRKLKAENLLLEEKVAKRTHELQEEKEKVESTLTELKSTQAQLIQSEKMASLGELTAGIAHEIQNPLNFVNNFSDVNKELLSEMKDEIDKGNIDEVKIIANDLIDNEEKINHHGKRADAIVKGMLQHSRTSTGQKEPTDINKLADEYLRLAYHGLRAKDKSFNAEIKTAFDEGIGNINIIPQDIGRVLLNLYNNAFYAINDKKKQLSENYEPTISVSTRKINDKIEITVKDNGNGIPQKVVDKIFQPFFTTKPTGEGTGLGLSLSYDVIKVHGGEIKVETKEGEGTTFTIQLPVS